MDESLIQIRVATLKGLLSIAVSHGLEQKDPIMEPLMVIYLYFENTYKTWKILLNFDFALFLES